MKVLLYPASELRRKAEPITREMVESAEFKANLAEMVELAKQDGIGLAATQVGWNVSLFVVLVDRNLQRLEAPEVFINPKIVTQAATQAAAIEGCLSFPGFEASIPRPCWIQFEWETLDGAKHQTDAHYVPESRDGYYIRILQHETDHLNGVVLIDHLSAAKRLKFDKWLKDRKS